MFNRQYYISKSNSSDFQLEGFSIFKFGEWSVYFHKDNNVSYYKSDSREFFIIGCFVHPEYPTVSCENFCTEVLSSCLSFSELNSRLKKMCGRYILLTTIEGETRIRADAVSLAQVYYSLSHNFVCSDIKLFEFFFPGEQLCSEAYDFYKHTMPKKENGDGWIGDKTIYFLLKKLLPNHVLKLSDMSVERYWPTERIIYSDLNEIKSELADNLIATMQAFQNIKSLSIAVTAGNDSRLVLAASLKLKNPSYYFIDRLPYMTDDEPDLVIGRELCQKAGVKFNVHDFSRPRTIPDDFKNKYFSSCFFAKESRLNVVYNYKFNLNDCINICGVGEFGRSTFGVYDTSVSARFLAYKYHNYGNSHYAVRSVESWLGEYKRYASHTGYNVASIFYIEQKLGNWGAVGNAESDIVIEEVNPFASHYFFEKFLSLPPSETTYLNNKLFSSLTSSFTDLFEGIPINPPVSVKEHIKKFTRHSMVSRFFDFVRYRIFVVKNKSEF